MKLGSPKLEPIRRSVDEAYENFDGKPVKWKRVHQAPDYVYFNHSVHINRGVSCVSCHGDVGEMRVVKHAEPHSMGWCLDCHAEHPSIDKNYGEYADLRRAELKDCWTCHN